MDQQNQRIISRLDAWKQKYEAKGDLDAAARMQESIDRWSATGSRPVPKPSIWDRLPFWAQFLIVVAAGLISGALIHFYLEYMLLPILIIPGFIAFLAGALKNGADM